MSLLQKLFDANVPMVFCDLPAQRGAIGRFVLQQKVGGRTGGGPHRRTDEGRPRREGRQGRPVGPKWKRHLAPEAGQKAAVRERQEQAKAFASDTMNAIEAIRAAGTTSAAGIERAEPAGASLLTSS
jgi:hypothetical protein